MTHPHDPNRNMTKKIKIKGMKKKKLVDKIKQKWTADHDQNSGERYQSDENDDMDEFEKLSRDIYYDANAAVYSKKKKTKLKEDWEEEENKGIAEIQKILEEGRRVGYSAALFRKLVELVVNGHFVFIHPERYIQYASHWTGFNNASAKQVLGKVVVANYGKNPLSTSARERLKKDIGSDIKEVQNKIEKMKASSTKLSDKTLKLEALDELKGTLSEEIAIRKARTLYKEIRDLLRPVISKIELVGSASDCMMWLMI